MPSHEHIDMQKLFIFTPISINSLKQLRNKINLHKDHLLKTLVRAQTSNISNENSICQLTLQQYELRNHVDQQCDKESIHVSH